MAYFNSPVFFIEKWGVAIWELQVEINNYKWRYNK